jgi:hypothetical protein
VGEEYLIELVAESIAMEQHVELRNHLFPNVGQGI